MHLKILLLLSFICSSPLWARNAWNGNWKGQGAVTLEDGTVEACGVFNILINHQKQPKWEGLWVMSGLPGCDLPTVLGVSFQLDVKGSELIHIGQVVGEYAPNKISMVRYSETFKEFIELFQSSEDELIYRKTLTFKGPLESYVIEASLERDF